MVNNEFISNNEALDSVVFIEGPGNRSYPEEGSETVIGNEINFQTPSVYKLGRVAIESAEGDK